MTTTAISHTDGNGTRRGAWFQLIVPVLLLAVLLLGGCLPAESDGDFVAVPEIHGTYLDDFGGTHVIGKDTWDDGFSLFHYVRVRNGLDYLIAQNDAGNSFNPNLYSRFDWTVSSDELYYCQIAFAAATADDAEANTAADRGNLATGCNGFAWSKLTPQ
jgi:hypothetical protein